MPNARLRRSRCTAEPVNYVDLPAYEIRILSSGRHHFPLLCLHHCRPAAPPFKLFLKLLSSYLLLPGVTQFLAIEFIASRHLEFDVAVRRRVCLFQLRSIHRHTFQELDSYSCSISHLSVTSAYLYIQRRFVKLSS